MSNIFSIKTAIETDVCVEKASEITCVICNQNNLKTIVNANVANTNSMHNAGTGYTPYGSMRYIGICLNCLNGLKDLLPKLIVEELKK